MAWRRLGYGMTKAVADDVAKSERKQGERVKVTKGKMGYSVLIWVSKRKTGEPQRRRK